LLSVLSSISVRELKAMGGINGRLFIASVAWRKSRGIFIGMAFLCALLLPGSAAMAICAGPPGSGNWTNTDRGGSPYWIRIDLISCGDVSHNGAPPAPTRIGVWVWVKRSDGTLYPRPRVEGRVQGGAVTARVTTGGYVDVMTMRPVQIGGRGFLDVDIVHQSLDSKPSSRSRYRFERGHIRPAPAPPVVIRPGRVPPVIIPPILTLAPTSFFGTGDWDRDGHVDIVVRRNNGDLYLYPGQSRRGYSRADSVQIGNGWNGATFFGMGDWDKDGHLDLVVRRTNGDLYLYPGESRRGTSRADAVQIGNGWNESTFYGMGDWDRDGHLDLVVRRKNGDLYLYPGESLRGTSREDAVQIGNGWNGTTFYGMGDWDRDGHVDLVVRRTNGDLYLYPGESRRGYSQADAVQIGSGWNDYAFYGMADWDRDGHLDIVARGTNGDLYLYPGESRRGPSRVDRVQIGNGW
jgi:hypothetical protein